MQLLLYQECAAADMRDRFVDTRIVSFRFLVVGQLWTVEGESWPKDGVKSVGKARVSSESAAKASAGTRVWAMAASRA